MPENEMTAQSDIPLSRRLLKALGLASLMLAAFDFGRYMAVRGYDVKFPLRARFDLLLIDMALGFLIGLGVLYLPSKTRLFVALAVIALAFSTGVGITAIAMGARPVFSPG